MLDYLGAFFTVMGRALLLEPNALEGTEAYGQWAIPFGIITIAALSTIAGEAIVLSLNHVRGLRHLFTLSMSILGRVLTYLTLGSLIWLVGTIVLGEAPELNHVVRTVSVSAAPYVFGFLIMLPYSGPGVERIIQLWSLLSLWAIVMHELDTERWRALLITAIAVAAATFVGRILGRPLAWIRDRLWRLFTGEHLMLSSQEVLDQFPLPELADHVDEEDAGGVP